MTGNSKQSGDNFPQTANYQALARRYRPQRFADVLGQEAIVTTLINALQGDRLAHAYLFSGARGTGKTTLARILAKAINCEQRQDGEPCNSCPSCHEITSGASLDILEIDGASHRGIDDIRQINETVGYAAPKGHHKVYIIDEVHMLTKEAFNALLKTLEEPPPKVKFFFATTEPHKIPPTIISRCQRFQLSRLTPELIITKLRAECQELSATITDPALSLIAQAAEGGMRDAESILDQVLSFHGQEIDEQAVADVLGLAPKTTYIRLDEAAKTHDLSIPFDIVDEVFSSGRDLTHFITGLIEHHRSHLLHAISNTPTPYTRAQLLTLLDDLLLAQERFRHAPSKRIALEMMLTRIVRTPRQIPLEELVDRLISLESRLDSPLPPP